MNRKLASVVLIIVGVGVGFVAWQSYSGASNQIEKQKASIYDVTGERLDGQTAYADAVIAQPLIDDYCLGLNNRGQALIGTSYRKVFSFSRSCKIIDVDLPNSIASNLLDADRFWFGGLVGSQCYSVTTDNAGTPKQVFLEQDIKDKEACLIN